MVNEGLTEEEVLQNTVSVQINFESIREERVSESKVMSKTQLLSNIGGQMGVFLGVSFISLIELFGELMVFRLLPRLGGDRRLYGIGSKSD
jgi:Amiloride-sensitive sodium channel